MQVEELPDLSENSLAVGSYDFGEGPLISSNGLSDQALRIGRQLAGRGPGVKSCLLIFSVSATHRQQYIKSKDLTPSRAIIGAA